ncbi:amidohydrolase family protein [Microbulbifer halophilus]|uniref:Amidohydrolase family protein n=1 Tax=Microbulbifer halophilus TaxID=453963 RepID=A0ABW5E8X2_9GAMM|nr:amidohydrolase family protein [Microbulbifer halophilus]MCW8125485.1 amidohydrolase family protein [Microbulbifer halophilus]
MRGICFLGLLLAVLATGCERGERKSLEREAGAEAPQSAVQPAELVFKGGHIYTPDEAKQIARAMAVRDGRIVFVGSDGDVGAYIGPDTRVENLQGKLVLPGLVDVHGHLLAPGDRVDLYAGKNVADYREVVAKYIREHPDRQLIVGKGWRHTAFAGQPPHKGQLDQVSDTIPIILFSSDHQSVWANSEALAAAGINNDTPDPPGGAIEKDDTGLAIGVLRGDSAVALVGKIIPEKAAQDYRAEIREIKESGGLETSAWADFVVLDKSAAGAGLEKIHQAKVLRAYYKGKPVFDAKNNR